MDKPRWFVSYFLGALYMGASMSCPEIWKKVSVALVFGGSACLIETLRSSYEEDKF